MLQCLTVAVILQVKEILHLRIKEEAASQLSVSVYDTERNEKAKLHRQELVNILCSGRTYNTFLLRVLLIFFRLFFSSCTVQ